MKTRTRYFNEFSHIDNWANSVPGEIKNLKVVPVGLGAVATVFYEEHTAISAEPDIQKGKGPNEEPVETNHPSVALFVTNTSDQDNAVNVLSQNGPVHDKVFPTHAFGARIIVLEHGDILKINGNYTVEMM